MADENEEQKEVTAYQVALEEILTAAIDYARITLAEYEKTGSDFHSGEIMGLYHVLSVAQEEAEFHGLEYAGKSLNDFLITPEPQPC